MIARGEINIFPKEPHSFYGQDASSSGNWNITHYYFPFGNFISLFGFDIIHKGNHSTLFFSVLKWYLDFSCHKYHTSMSSYISGAILLLFTIFKSWVDFHWSVLELAPISWIWLVWKMVMNIVGEVPSAHFNIFFLSSSKSCISKAMMIK